MSAAARWGTAALVAALATGGTATPAHADLIFTPLFTYLLTAAGVSATAIAFGTTTWVSLLSGVATIAFGAGVMILLTPKPPKPETGAVPIQQAIPARIFAFGRVRLSGATVFAESLARTLYRVHALTGHPIIGFVGWYLHDDRVTLNEDGTIVDTGGDKRYSYAYAVKLEGRTGDVPEAAYADLVAASGDVWTENHRGDGCASLMMRCNPVKAKSFTDAYPYGPPQPSAVIDAAKVFDPRDVNQSWDDPSTWGNAGYDNPIIQLIFWECFSPYGTRRDYQASVLPVLAHWIGEADICDEMVAVKSGGTEKRYRAAWWGDTERHDPRAGRQNILHACDGWMVERGDKTIMVWVGKYRAPTVVLTDDDICGWSWQSSVPNNERAEMMTAKYTSPENGYTSVETDPVMLDNGPISSDQRRTASYDLTSTQSTGQASRLLRREVKRYGEDIRGSIDLRLSGLDAVYERWIYLDVSIPRLAGRVIENRRPTISIMKGMCQIEYIGSGPHIDAYSPVTDESAPPYVPTRPQDVGLPIPVVVSAVAVQVEAGATVSIWIEVTIDAPQKNGADDTTLTYGLRWRRVGDEAWVSSVVEEYDIVNHLIVLSTGLVAAGTTYEVEVASIGASGTYSDWAEPTEVSTDPASVAPDSPGLSIVPGSGSAVATITTPNSPNVTAVRLWRAAGGSPFSAATDVSGEIFCSPNQVVSHTDSPIAAGAWSWWATSENTYGTRSTPTGPVNATVS